MNALPPESRSAFDGDSGVPVKAPGPFSAFEWLLAGRYLRARRKEAFISVIAGFSFIGIMLGVATLIIVMAVMNGFRAELLTRILGMNGHVIVQPIDYDLTDYAAVADRLSGVEGVRLAVPLVEGQALVSGQRGTAGTGALIRGVREKDIQQIKGISGNVREGTLAGFDENEGVAIGIRLAQNLGLHAGDLLTIISPEGDVTPFGTTPRVKAYPVVAIFEIGMSEYDASIAYLPLSEAQLYFNSEAKVSAIEVYVDEPDSVGSMRDAIATAIARPHFLTDWRQRNMSFFTALQVERNVMFMILTLIILVAALNIISGLTMLVKDKGRDIAILRTMGATRFSIMRIFMMTGSAIGISGTVVGVLLGVLVCLNIKAIQNFVDWLVGGHVWDPTVRFLSDIPARMDTGETVSIVVMALALSFLATIFPAWRAARLDPVEALRYE
ncbi:MAG: lipoprotein-releasing ABC transporter permease subunit [Rhizobiaceae bacterium]